MDKQKLGIGAAIILILFIGFYFFLGEEPPPEEVASVVQTPQSPPMPPDDVIVNETEVPKLKLVDDPTQADTELTTPPKDHMAGKPEIKQRLEEIAAEYAENLKIPAYSQVIDETAPTLKPYQFRPYQRHFGNFQYDVVLPKANYFYPEIIPYKFRIFASQSEPIPEIFNIIAEISNETGLVLASFEIPQTTNDEMEKTYTLDIAPPADDSTAWSGELKILTKFLVMGYGDKALVTQIQYQVSVGEIVSIDDTTVEGPHLIIPVHVNVPKQAQYKLRGHLFSQQSGLPLLLLDETQLLNQGMNTVMLKAHISGIKWVNDEGPYQLKSFILERMPDAINKISYGMGNTDNVTFNIPAHSFDQYKDEPYSDSAEQQKLQRFQQIIHNIK
ncbi:MAG: hypothetical protein HQM11_17900 [SAR324 cluster bacterium]|nr:hypothetical protein [SAR324 cluster bacterium]